MYFNGVSKPRSLRDNCYMIYCSPLGCSYVGIKFDCLGFSHTYRYRIPEGYISVFCKSMHVSECRQKGEQKMVTLADLTKLITGK